MLIREMYYKKYLFLCLIYFSNASVVKFLPSTNFNLPMNFKDGKLPCSKETIVFPETILGSIRLDSDTSVSGLILPRDGEIILADGSIEFGADITDVNCTREGNSYYLESGVASWGQPDVWSSPKFNDATPDAERVPCFDDVVEFSDMDRFSLTLPDETQSLSGIKIRNYSIHSDLFKQLVSMDKNWVMNSYGGTGLIFEQKQCRSRAGCPCQNNPLKISCELKYCSVPACVDPVKPVGHCCKICGGYIIFDIDESFDMMAFKELVEKTVESYGTNSLAYHVGRLPQNKVQVVVVDKSEYSGTSAQVINAIDNRFERHWVQGAKHVAISGSPLDKAGLTGKIFVSMLFLVVLVMGGIYVYYYKLPVSDVRFPILHRNAPGVFSRFETRTDSVVCLTRRDSETPIGRGADVGTAFRNPLYDSTRERVRDNDSINDE